MLKLLASHPNASIFTSLLSRLQHRNWSPNAYDIGWSRRERAQAGIEFYGVSQYKIENDLEVGFYDTRQGRAKVFAMDVISEFPLLLASHIAAVCHGHKGVQRDVKCRHRGIGL